MTGFVRAHLPSKLTATQTVKQQAKAVGVSDAQLSDVLSGKATVGKATLPLFARALGMSVEELISASRASDMSGTVGALSTNEVSGADAGERDAVLDQAAELLIREGYEMRRAEHAARWVGREPERRDGPVPLTAKRVAALARALLEAEDALQKTRSSLPPSAGPTGASTRHKIRRSSGAK